MIISFLLIGDKDMSTRQRILDESLTLFAEKGFSSVTVSDIAKAVGIKAPSLYKHFKSKQEIFDSCMEIVTERIDQVRNNVYLSSMKNQKDLSKIIDYNDIIDFVMNLFMFYLRDEVASKVRRVLQIERYRNSDLNEMYEALIINNAIKIEEGLFASLIEAGILREANPHTMALQFYPPILFLVEKYDLHPELDEDAKEEMLSLIHDFYVRYTIEKS